MANVTLNISALPSENPVVTPPSGWDWTVGSGAGRINNGVGFYPTSGSASPSGWTYSTHLNVVSNEVSFGQNVAGVTLNSYTTGVTLISPSGGYWLQKEPFATKIYRLTGSSLAGTKTQIATIASAPSTVGKEILIKYNVSTGLVSAYYDGALVVSATDTTYASETFRGGFAVAGYNHAIGVGAATAYNVAVHTITSINGGNPITAGQTGIAVEATGFSAKPTGVTATYASGAKSITATVDSGGTATNFNISIQDRIEAEDWPVTGDTLTFTFTYLTESATGTQTLVKKATETVLTVSGGITSDPATWTYWLTQDGFTVEGGENVYDPYGDLVLTADGGGSATNTGTFTSWWRPSTGTGAGNVYAYTWVITESGISPASKNITSLGLTSSGFTSVGLTSSGI